MSHWHANTNKKQFEEGVVSGILVFSHARVVAVMSHSHRNTNKEQFEDGVVSSWRGLFSCWSSGSNESFTQKYKQRAV